MSGSERFLSQNILRPSALNGNLSTTTQRLDYGFTPIAMVPPRQNQFSPRPVRPVPTCSGIWPESVTTTTGGSNGLTLKSSSLGGSSTNGLTNNIPLGGVSATSPPSSIDSTPSPPGVIGDKVLMDGSRPYKRKPMLYNPPSSNSTALSEDGLNLEPRRKLHLSEDYVAQTMSELYISPPTCKVAKRDMNRDVAEAINLEALEELESKFSNSAINDDVILPQRLRRSRKLPSRQRQPQLRIKLHQDLKNIKSGGVLPESLISRYRPNTRPGNSTALVLWKPPEGFLPDLINHALHAGPVGGWTSRGSRPRCYSEVTSTPYSSHENLYGVEEDDVKMMHRGDRTMSANHSPQSAEAPELSTSPQSEDEILPSVGLQRRNSAPEISEPLQYMDDDRCMEL